MRKKPTIVVIAVMAALAIAVTVLAVINRNHSAEKRQLLADGAFLVIAGDVEYKITMAELLSLQPREFEANYKKSGLDPETRSYTGLPFAELLRWKGIDSAGYTTAVFSAADGYASPISIADALNENNCYIAIDHEGDGPFRMILAQDQFSQRWCKLLTDVHLR